jgi:hypothetical protein
MISELSWKSLYKILKHSFGGLKVNQNWLFSNFFSKNADLVGNCEELVLKTQLGGELDLRSTQLISNFMNKLGFGFIKSSEDLEVLDVDFRTGYLFNDVFQSCSKADFIVFIGSNPRIESAVLNIKLRRIFRNRKVTPYVLGSNTDFGYPVNFIGTNLSEFYKLVKGRHWLNSFLAKSNNPLFIIGPSAYKESSFQKALKCLLNNLTLKGNWVPYSFLGLRPGLTCFNETGVLAYKYNKFLSNVKIPSIKFLYYADDFTENQYSDDSELVIYQGHHGDQGARIADIVVPGLTPFEKMSFYVNLEGVFVNSVRSIIRYMRSVPGDLVFFKSLMRYCQIDFFLDQKNSDLLKLETWYARLPISTVFEKTKFFSEFVFFSSFDTYKIIYLTPLTNSKVLTSLHFFKPTESMVLSLLSKNFTIPKLNVSVFVENFYMTSVIGRFSRVMSLASQLLRKNYKTF